MDIQQEARYWSIEPSNYPNDKALAQAIQDKKDARQSVHPPTQADVDAGEATEVALPGAVGEQVKEVKKPRKK